MTAIQLICDAVDAIAHCDGRALPKGALASLYRRVDATRRDKFSAAHVHAVEEIAADVVRLINMQRLPATVGDAEAARIKHALPAACWRWVADLPIGCA